MINFRESKTYSLFDRESKVTANDLGDASSYINSSARYWLYSLPNSFMTRELKLAAGEIAFAYSRGYPIGVALGGHVIKTGCGPYLIDWVKRGIVKFVAMNGAAAIHDIELAIAGHTSEDVSATLHEGTFGWAKETAEVFADALSYPENVGLGARLSHRLSNADINDMGISLLKTCDNNKVPHTVHVAIGTDVVHMHPNVMGCSARLGEASMCDFCTLCNFVSEMKHGIWINLGSAVVMPEIFMKAVSVARNHGCNLDGLTTINLDKKEQYRTKVNVLERPTRISYDLLGCHEIMIPLLHLLVEHRLTEQQEN